MDPGNRVQGVTMPRRLRTIAALFGVLVGSAAAAALAAAALSGSTSTQRPAAQRSSNSTTPSGVAQASFELLRRPVQPSDSTAPLTALAGAPIASAAWQNRVGIDLSQARRSTLSGHGVWLDAGSTNACMFYLSPSGGSGGACTTPMQLAATGEVVTIANANGTTSVVGVLPDTAQSVQLTLVDGSSQPVSVVENAFWADAPSDPVKLTYPGANGQQTISLSIEH